MYELKNYKSVTLLELKMLQNEYYIEIVHFAYAVNRPWLQGCIVIKGAHEQNGSKMSAEGKFLEKPRLQLDTEHELGRGGGVLAASGKSIGFRYT